MIKIEKKSKCRGSNDKTVKAIINTPPSRTDPNGSYTGRPINKNELPQQDADDL